ncbi:MAG: hypothetical protein F6K41_13995 [Symploca sp. SIO3E6]|nr:hypothetical protein [Caldora sp. SIO3E6]
MSNLNQTKDTVNGQEKTQDTFRRTQTLSIKADRILNDENREFASSRFVQLGEQIVTLNSGTPQNWGARGASGSYTGKYKGFRLKPRASYNDRRIK